MTMFLEPWRNPEGYMDMTAYLAIHKGGNDMNSWSYLKDGDIIKLKRLDDKIVYKAILKMHTNYATTLYLFDDESRENEFMIMADWEMHADLGKIGYTKIPDLERSELVRHMENEELERLRGEVAACMGLSMIHDFNSGDDNDYEAQCRVLTNKASLLTMQNEQYKKEIEKSEGLVAKLREELDAMNTINQSGELSSGKMAQSLARACAERDVYEKLYFDLISRCGLGIPGGPIVSYSNNGG